jgi:sulfur-carrier protein
MEAHIQLKLFATLRKFNPETSEAYPIGPAMTVQDVITQLGIPTKQAKLIFINGRRGEASSPLRDGDRLGIFPPVGGG